ncbi:helix-turn-helix domain-containing protein [Roseburia faecis]|jgi:hypothetical protein|uniref:helix-turn-helix domain-containing protein n=1 Tax=Roseburia faecis TaxID=301302 RepID=UPI0031B5FD56
MFDILSFSLNAVPAPEQDAEKLEKLNSLLQNVGAKAYFKESEGVRLLMIEYDLYESNVKSTRRAGRKGQKYDYTVKQVQQLIEEKGITAAAEFLGMSRQGLRKRLNKRIEEGKENF